MNEKSIRDLAHQIWEMEGKPEGQSEHHWTLARLKLTQAANHSNKNTNRSIDPSEATGSTEPAQPDQT